MRPRAVAIALWGVAAAATAARAPDWVVRASMTTISPDLLGTEPAPDAVVLWRQQIVTAGATTGSTKLFERAAVKILTARGKEAGTFSSSYDDDSKVDVEGAWTLHGDGTAEQLDLDEVVSTQLAHAEYFTDTHLIAFRPPRLSPGDIASVALSRKSRRDVYQWILRLQETSPIAAQEVVIDLPEGWTHRWRLRGVPEGYTRELSGAGGAKATYPFGPQRGVPEEESSPPYADRLASLEVEIEPPPGKFPELVFRTWKDVGAWFFRKSLPARTEAPPDLVPAVEQSPTGAARWVQDKVRYVALEVGEGGYVPREPSLVARRLYGDCKDKSFLYMAILARKGVEVFPVLTRALNFGAIDPDFPSPVQFNHLIVAVRTAAPANLPAEVKLDDGTVVLFDPTDPWTPFGQLPPSLYGSRGLLVRKDNADLIEFPRGIARDNRQSRTLDAQVSAAGQIVLTVGDVTTGALAQRHIYQELTPLQRDDRMLRLAANAIPGSHASKLELSNLDDRDKPMEVRFFVTSDGYLRRTGNLLLMPVLPFAIGPSRVSRLDHRRSPIELGLPKSRELTASFQLADGLRVDALPDPIDVDNAYAHYQFRVSVEKGRLVTTEIYEVKRELVPVSDMASWKAIEAAAARAAASKAVLAGG